MKKLLGLFALLKKVISILDNKEKRFFYYLSFAFFFVAIIETFGVVLIIPFIEIASNPEIINSNYQLNLINDFFQFKFSFVNSLKTIAHSRHLEYLLNQKGRNLSAKKP